VITKRVFLLGMLFSQSLAYKILTEARYLGQGLEPNYLKFNTIGDILSIGIALLSVFLVLRTLLRPEYMSLSRIIAATLFSHLLLWLDYGVKRFEASELSPVASIALILSTCMLLGTLLTRSNPEKRMRLRGLRILRNASLVFLTLASFSFLYAFSYPAYTNIKEITDYNADAAVVLGAAVWRGNNLGERPSPTLNERINVAHELVTKKSVPRVVVTGGAAPGEQAEAVVARKEFIKRGIDPARIIAETMSRSTLDQVIYMREELHKKQNWDRFVVISDQYHLARVGEMCKFNGVDAITAPSRIEQPFLDLAWYRIRESMALLAYWLIGK
jgi:uncharacterized SAM-binding protein YcdF (DUF218 family)